MGGGALPTTELAGWAVALTFTDTSVDQCATILRQAEIPVIARIQEDRLILNLRTVLPAQEAFTARRVNRRLWPKELTKTIMASQRNIIIGTGRSR